MTDAPNQPLPASLAVNEIEANLSKMQAEIESAVEALEVNVDEIDYLGSELTAFEESPHFKGLTEHNHQQLMLDWREYICALKAGVEKVKEELSQAKHSQQLAADITCQELAAEVNKLEQHQEDTK